MKLLGTKEIIFLEFLINKIITKIKKYI